MQFIVEFHLKPGSKRKAVEAFELRVPMRNLGVELRSAWIGTQSDIVFLLAEGADESLVKQVGESWSEYGTIQVYPVIDIEQF